MFRRLPFLLMLLAVMVMTACAVWRTPQIARIALLAPFEGRYREIGYSALYPARLSLADAGNEVLELLAVDDGGSIETAQARARALLLDDTVKAVIVLGYDASDAQTQRAFGDMPVLIVGAWATIPIGERVFILTHPDIRQRLSLSERIEITDGAEVNAPFVGGEVFGLSGFARLRQELDGIEVVTSGKLPTDDFIARIFASDPFATAPNHLALNVYDAVGMLATIITRPDMTRQAVYDAVRLIDYEGQGGRIVFDEFGYWSSAPMYTYRYQEGKLVLSD